MVERGRSPVDPPPDPAAEPTDDTPADLATDPSTEVSAEAPADQPSRKLPIDQAGIALFAIPLAVLTIMAWIGDIFAPSLLGDAPLLLIVLNPRLRNLVLVAPTVGAAPFIIIAVARLVIGDPFFFWFGRRYGDVAIRWMESRLGSGAAIVLWLERAFRRAAYPMVAALPNNWICLLAGATPMRWWVFLTLNVGGTFVRVILVWLLGEAFADPILAVNEWIGEHRWQLTLVTFSLVAFAIWRQSRKRGGILESPRELHEELDAEQTGESPTA
jgi:membrane protein DedA with SNARE-associated domain